MFLDVKRGHAYLRQWDGDSNQTVAKYRDVEEPAHLYKPKLLNEKAENLLAQLPDNSVDLIITDPPYGVSTRVGRSQYDGQYEMSAKDNGRITNHDGLEFLDGIPQQIQRVLKRDSHLYVFCNHESYPQMRARFSQTFDMSQLLVWEKPTYGVGDSETYSPVHEFIMHYRYGSPTLRYGGDSKRPKNVVEFKRTCNNGEIVAHATQKPIELINFLIEKSSDPADLIADPYGGSFATGRAAQHSLRRGVCAEIDPEIAADGQQLAEYQLQNDPVYGIDWTDTHGVEIAQTTVPASEPVNADNSEVKADD